ncbi:MAG: hypothetical protein LUD02_02600 [Tannerellaceae bacterium]|nr:hypothetical protein [Tannerellaceae bacterium]MCD8263165.1 hypothetical protein [Tannerellaceae bacterium]
MKIYRNNTLVADVILKDNSYISDEIMGACLLSISFDILQPVDFEINDYTDFEGERYKIRHAESVKKDQTFSGYTYTITFYGSQYELQNTVFFLHGKPERLKHGATFRGTAAKILELIVANMNRNDSGWKVGNCIETAEETFDFTDMSCGNALDAVVKQFDTEYYINGKIISIGRQAYPAHEMTFGYGKGRGFRELEVMATEDQPPLTVLYPYGSDRNLNPEYGSDYLLLPGGQLSLEKMWLNMDVLSVQNSLTIFILKEYLK